MASNDDVKTALATTSMHDDPWGSPSHLDMQTASQAEEEHTRTNARPHSRSGDSKFAQEQSKEQALHNELESVRRVNEAIEGVIESLDKAKGSMGTVNQTVNSVSTLLNMWTRILSQTEHNQRLILNPAWQGASQDIADMEQQIYARQQAAERREAEEQERRAAAVQKAEDDERRRVEATSRTTKPTSRGRGRPAGRAGTTAQPATPAYVTMGGQGTRGSARGSNAGARRSMTGVGRIYGAGRGRGTGS